MSKEQASLILCVAILDCWFAAFLIAHSMGWMNVPKSSPMAVSAGIGHLKSIFDKMIIDIDINNFKIHDQAACVKLGELS
jgi:cytochrome bd-type quinol oxidase subunit 1